MILDKLITILMILCICVSTFCSLKMSKLILLKSSNKIKEDEYNLQRKSILNKSFISMICITLLTILSYIL